jgi:hypothetical protein
VGGLEQADCLIVLVNVNASSGHKGCGSGSSPGEGCLRERLASAGHEDAQVQCGACEGRCRVRCRVRCGVRCGAGCGAVQGAVRVRVRCKEQGGARGSGTEGKGTGNEKGERVAPSALVNGGETRRN